MFSPSGSLIPSMKREELKLQTVAADRVSLGRAAKAFTAVMSQFIDQPISQTSFTLHLSKCFTKLRKLKRLTHVIHLVKETWSPICIKFCPGRSLPFHVTSWKGQGRRLSNKCRRGYRTERPSMTTEVTLFKYL